MYRKNLKRTSHTASGVYMNMAYRFQQTDLPYRLTADVGAGW